MPFEQNKISKNKSKLISLLFCIDKINEQDY